MNLLYRAATISEIIQLRHDVLIAGTTRVSGDFPGDDDPTTLHYGAFDGDRNVACLSFMKAECNGQPSYQLRGMAVDPAFQGKKIGETLLQKAENKLIARAPTPLIWCNARLGVEGFYQKQGWKIASEPFMIEGVCMHYKMIKNLT